MARKFDIECFNSTLVQLKASLRNCPFGRYTSFNSTLVQLKVGFV